MKFSIFSTKIIYLIFLFSFELNANCTGDLDGYPLGNNKVKFITKLLDVMKENSAVSNNNKKIEFMNKLLPMAVAAIEKVEIERDFLTTIRNKKNLSNEEQDKLTLIKKKYRTENLDELRLRVNIIPLDLILTQSALESGWGATALATKCNNLFGVKAIGGLDACTANKSKNASFSSFEEAVEYYILNLNRGENYNQFRIHRQEILDLKKELTGISLAPDLIKYSIRKKGYTDALVKMNKSNKFSDTVIEAIRLTETYDESSLKADN